MPDLAVKIDNQYVPLTQCDWVWRKPCGCPLGVMSAANVADEHDAWHLFPGTGRERNLALSCGVEVELMTHERYGREVAPLLRGGSGHVCGKENDRG